MPAISTRTVAAVLAAVAALVQGGCRGRPPKPLDYAAADGAVAPRTDAPLNLTDAGCVSVEYIAMDTVPAAIPEGLEASLAIRADDGLPNLRSVRVSFVMTHPYPTEVRARLVGPTGTSVVLLDGRDGQSLAVDREIFEFAGPIATGDVWVFYMSDAVSRDIGELVSLSITLNRCP